MTRIELVCARCQSPFTKPLNEYNRRLRCGQTRFYCGTRCSVEASNEITPRKGNVDHLRPRDQRDEYTPFRWFLKRAQYRSRHAGKESSLALEDIKSLWERQAGVCPLTGWEMLLPVSSTIGFMHHDPRNASLDRLDNSLGYAVGNVRFVCLIANLARSEFADVDVISFCDAVSTHAH